MTLFICAVLVGQHHIIENVKDKSFICWFMTRLKTETCQVMRIRTTPKMTHQERLVELGVWP
jgi:hypothetical protein